jgi:hypothetical protein
MADNDAIYTSRAARLRCIKSYRTSEGPTKSFPRSFLPKWPWCVAHAKNLTIRSETAPYTNCLRVGGEKRSAATPSPSKTAVQGRGYGCSNCQFNYLQLNKEARLLKEHSALICLTN